MSDYIINNPNTQLRDLIHVERGIIPDNLCDHIIQDIGTREWRPHTWYNNVQGSYGSEETMELDVQGITPELQQLLTPLMIQAGAAYNNKYAYPCERTGQLMNKFSSIRFNRYSSGQIMRQHHDHIHSLFDGNEKGIPVLSFILNLNDDYEGADLYFWKDHIVNLGKGDIIMFPSLFLFPHGVTEATKGTRYSAVSWAW
tara:strand:+ start:168 stop:764 length:597 start_codon:yes stop_codon:yes gene_type:complete